MTTPTPDLIVFGGTFDPPHVDHLEAVLAALRIFPKAQVWVLPAAAPAVAGGGAKAPEASFEDRMAMTRALFREHAAQVEVLPLEAELMRPNYTVNTLRAVQERAPGKTLGLLLGEDQAVSFARWRDPGAILDLASLVVVGRRTPGTEKSFDGLRDALGVLFQSLPKAQERTRIVVGLDVGPAASHTIRERLAAGEAVPKDWLAPQVAAYINEHALYSKRNDP